jgi:hypothetical protein
MKISIPVTSIFVIAVTAAIAQTGPNGWIGLHDEGTLAIGHSSPVTGRPFSGTELRRTVQTLADGTHVDRTETGTLYRDAQGRTRSESSRRVVIYDPVAGFTYNLDKANKTYEKYATHGEHMAAHHDQEIALAFHGGPGGHPFIETLPQQFVNGINAKGSRITTVVPVGAFGNDRDIKIVNEHWYSDDLQILLKTTNSDPRFGVTTYDLTNIQQTAPNPSLFQVPSDYRQQTEGHHE